MNWLWDVLYLCVLFSDQGLFGVTRLGLHMSVARISVGVGLGRGRVMLGFDCTYGLAYPYQAAQHILRPYEQSFKPIRISNITVQHAIEYLLILRSLILFSSVSERSAGR